LLFFFRCLKTNSGSGLAVEGDLNYKSNNVIIEGTYKESFPDFHDDPKVGKKPKPPKEEKKPFNWVGVIVAVVVVTLVVITAPVDAIVVCAVAAVGAVVAFAADVGTQLMQNGRKLSDVKWDEAIIAACCGAISGAFAATGIERAGQGVINAVIGGTQAALNGGSAKDIAEGAIECGVAGLAGGSGYQKSFHLFNPDSLFSKAFFSKEALMGARKGIIAGVGVPLGVNAVEYAFGYVKNIFSNNKSKKENEVAPAK